MSNLQLEDLPDEIVLRIFKNLEFEDLFSWYQVSKRFRAISQDACLWIKVNIWDQNTPLGLENKLFKMVALILVDMDGSMPNLEVVSVCNKDNLHQRSIVLETKQMPMPLFSPPLSHCYSTILKHRKKGAL